MSLQLNSADVRLLIEGLKAWIDQPVNSGMFVMMAGTILGKESEDEHHAKMVAKKLEVESKRDERQRQSRSLMDRLAAAAVGNAFQVTAAECLLLESGLQAWCIASSQEELITDLMKKMLFGRRDSERVESAMERLQDKRTQERRLRAIPTAYKLVMAINAASEFETSTANDANGR